MKKLYVIIFYFIMMAIFVECVSTTRTYNAEITARYEAFLEDTNSVAYNNIVVLSVAEKISHCLEFFTIGKEFKDMDSSWCDSLLSEYEELTENYFLLARESTDRTVAYIVGVYDGQAENCPQDGMYCISIEECSEQQLAYRMPSAVYMMGNSYFSYFNHGAVFIIQPKDVETNLNTTTIKTFLEIFIRFIQPDV